MNHDLFVAAAYGISAIAIVGMVTWILVDQGLRKRELAELQRRGVRRRSAGTDNAR